jgi:hypothetical protein
MKPMRSPKIQKPTKDVEQTKAFRRDAHELGTDSDEGRFQDALRKIAKHKPQPQPTKKEKRG